MPQPYWNPSDKDSDIALSDSNRTCATSQVGSVRSTTALSNSDGYYVELSWLGNSGNTGWRFGVATGSADITVAAGNGGHDSWVVRGNDAQLLHDGSIVGSTGFGRPDAVFMIAVKNGSVWFGENGTWSGDPAAGTGAAFTGLSGPLYLIFGHSATGVSRGCTFAEVGSYAYSAPSGFTAGWAPDTVEHALEADVSVSASVSAGLTATRRIAASLAASATTQGIFGLEKSLSTSVSATAILSGTARRNAVLGADLTASAAVTGRVRLSPTILHLRNVAADLSGYKTAANAAGTPDNVSWETTIPDSDGVWVETQLTDTAGGTALQWVSGYIAEAAELDGTITFTSRGVETFPNLNAYFKAKIWKRSRAGVETLIGGDSSVTPGDDFTSNEELATSIQMRTWTGTLPEPVSLDVDDRLVIRLYFISDNALSPSSARAYYDYAVSTNIATIVTLPDRFEFTDEPNQPAVDVQAAISVSGSVSAAVQVERGLFGDLSVAVTAAGDLVALHTLAASVGASASVQGAVDRTAGLWADLSANASTTAPLRLDLALAGGLSGTANTSADLTRIEGSMEGDLAVAVSLSGQATIGRGFSASIGANAAVAGSFDVSHALSGSLSVTATTVATVLSFEELEASVQVSVSVAGLLGVPRGIEADVSAASTIGGTLTRAAMPNGSVGATASVSATIGVARGMSAAIVGSVSTSGAIIRVLGMHGDLEVDVTAIANTSTDQRFSAGLVVEVFSSAKLTRPPRYYSVSRPAPVIMRS